MKRVLTHTTVPGGNRIFAQRPGSSVLGFLMTTSSTTVTRSPRFRCVTISLLISAWPRTLTFFSFATAGPGAIAGVDLGVLVEVLSLALSLSAALAFVDGVAFFSIFFFLVSVFLGSTG